MKIIITQNYSNTWLYLDFVDETIHRRLYSFYLQVLNNKLAFLAQISC